MPMQKRFPGCAACTGCRNSRGFWPLWRVLGAQFAPRAPISLPFTCRNKRTLGGRLGVSCGPSELPRRDADEALEMVGELALVTEAGAQGDLRQGHVGPCLQELLGSLHAAGDDVLVRGKPSGR